MISKIDKNTVRQRRHARVRKTVVGTAAAPRLNVYRSLNHIYAQVIDDRAGNEKGGVTLAAASTMDKDVKAQIEGLQIGRGESRRKSFGGARSCQRRRDGGFRQRRLPLHGTCESTCRRRERSRT